MRDTAAHNGDAITPFHAGRLKFFYAAWSTITSDQWILEEIQGVRIEFVRTPYQLSPSKGLTVNRSEALVVDSEINKLLEKRVIEPVSSEPGEYISSIFLHPKKDGTYRVILNLKPLNQFVEYHHLKMDTIYTAIQLMKQGCYMASIDLQDAYYTVPVYQGHRKYLRFAWYGQLYQYTCLPNGLAFAPRIFT